MDVAIPLVSYTNNDYLDLRYALRGIDLYVKPDKVYLIGGRPAWIKGIKHIQHKDTFDGKFKEKNIFDKLCMVPSDEFVYFNDDHYILQPWEEKYYYHETLLNRLYNLPRGSNYRTTVANTLRYCHKANNFDIHAPMQMTRESLIKLKKLPWGMDFGFCMKTLVANVSGITGTQYPDFKIRDKLAIPYDVIRSRSWFSTADGIVECMIPFMEECYKQKSRYEV